MKFTKEFFKILRNFSSINEHMLFVPGKVQTTVSCNQYSKTKINSLFARAKTDVEIDQKFGIIKLHEVLFLLTLFENPDIIIEDEKIMVISQGNKEVRYALTNPLYLSYEDNPDRIQVGNGITINFNIGDLKSLLDMHGIFKSENMSFFSKDGKFYVSVSHADNPTSHIGSILLGDTDEEFLAVIKTNSMKILPDTYKLTISRKGYVYFGNDQLEYFIPVDKKLSKL